MVGGHARRFGTGLSRGLVACVGAVALSSCGAPGAPGQASPSVTAGLDTPAGLIRLGDDVGKQGDMEGALLLYEAAILRDARNVTALDRIGATAMSLGQLRRSEQAFRAALVLDGTDAKAKYGLGIALLGMDRAGEALTLLSEISRGAPEPRYLRAYGVALDMAGRSEEAQAVYRTGLAQDPADADMRGNLALSLAAGGDFAAALVEGEAAAAAVIPNSVQAANFVLLLAVAGRETEARSRGDALLGTARTDALLRQSVLVRRAQDAPARATALGLLTRPPG